MDDNIFIEPPLQINKERVEQLVKLLKTKQNYEDRLLPQNRERQPLGGTLAILSLILKLLYKRLIINGKEYEMLMSVLNSADGCTFESVVDTMNQLIDFEIRGDSNE